MGKGDSRADFRKITDESNLLAICMTAEKEPNITQKTNYFLTKYTAAIGEDSYEAMKDIAKGDPQTLEESISQMREAHGKSLADEVKKSPEDVLKNIDAKYMSTIAYQFIGDESYRSVRKSLEEDGDTKKEFSNLYESELWKSLVALASNETIKSAATAYVDRTTRREMQEKFHKVKDGKLVYDPGKAAKFIASEIKKIDGKEREQHYRQIGLSYYQTQLDKGAIKPSDQVAKIKDSYKAKPKAKPSKAKTSKPSQRKQSSKKQNKAPARQAQERQAPAASQAPATSQAPAREENRETVQENPATPENTRVNTEPAPEENTQDTNTAEDSNNTEEPQNETAPEQEVEEAEQDNRLSLEAAEDEGVIIRRRMNTQKSGLSRNITWIKNNDPTSAQRRVDEGFMSTLNIPYVSSGINNTKPTRERDLNSNEKQVLLNRIN